MGLNWSKYIQWYTFAGIVLFVFLYAFGSVDYTDHQLIFWLDVSITVLTTVFLSVTQTIFYTILSKKFDYSGGEAKRILVILTVLSITVAINMTLIVISIHYLIYEPNPALCIGNFTLTEIIKSNVGIALVVNLLILLTIESIYLFKNWKNSLIRTEVLEKEKLDAELQALKNQINPHFLFNSLNTLSAVMQQSVPKAEQFILRFSSLYRYVLNVKDKSFVSLKEEMQHANDYVFLQKERFGSALNVSMDTTHENELFLPPLCLHELLENAIKHNRFGADSPLNIKIRVLENQLIVTNNYAPMKRKTDGTSFGHYNIIKRYELLNLSTPQFYIENGDYVVKLELISQWD